MAAASRARKPKNNAAPGLSSALAFVLQAQKKDGDAWQSHCRIENGWLTGFNGTLGAGQQIEEDLTACPNTAVMAAAIAKCGQSVAITQVDAQTLTVRSGRFRAVVPCLPLASVPEIEPDAPCAVIDDRLKAGFALLSPMLEDTAPRALEASVLLQAQSMVATDGFMMIETWHGIDLPPGLMIPRASAVAIAKAPKKLCQFGYSRNSATFYYEDGSYIKTQLFSGNYPDYGSMFKNDCNYWPLPDGFFEGIKTLEPFAKDANKRVSFSAEGMTVLAEDKRESGSFEMEGLHPGMAFNIDFLKIAMPVFHKVEFCKQESRLYFLSEDGMTRGIIMGLRL